MDRTAAQRDRMIWDQLERRGIRNQDVLRAMRETARHLFVPEDVRRLAYEDHALQIGHGATISQPYIVAFMTGLLRPDRRQRILEIGTGSGYQAAILAQLTAEVYSIENVPELAQSAAATLQELGYSNVTVLQGDGYEGWPEMAPFDGIIVTAAPPQVPEELIAQLAHGGRMVLPVGPRRVQQLMLIEKKPDGRIERRSMDEVSFIPMVPAHL
jgi:protein-L-isoaspartate(D-aspartate) O-methyltransferase